MDSKETHQEWIIEMQRLQFSTSQHLEETHLKNQKHITQETRVGTGTAMPSSLRYSRPLRREEAAQGGATARATYGAQPRRSVAGDS